MRPERGHIPSRNALKYLRDAALYGSLGTATGTAVLIAQERRRRICFATKVAENAAKLKSSSRYFHERLHLEPQGPDFAYLLADPAPARRRSRSNARRDSFLQSPLEEAYRGTSSNTSGHRGAEDGRQGREWLDAGFAAATPKVTKADQNLDTLFGHRNAENKRQGLEWVDDDVTASVSKVKKMDQGLSNPSGHRRAENSQGLEWLDANLSASASKVKKTDQSLQAHTVKASVPPQSRRKVFKDVIGASEPRSMQALRCQEPADPGSGMQSSRVEKSEQSNFASNSPFRTESRLRHMLAYQSLKVDRSNNPHGSKYSQQSRELSQDILGNALRSGSAVKVKATLWQIKLRTGLEVKHATMVFEGCRELIRTGRASEGMRILVRSKPLFSQDTWAWIERTGKILDLLDIALASGATAEAQSLAQMIRTYKPPGKTEWTALVVTKCHQLIAQNRVSGAASILISALWESDSLVTNDEVIGLFKDLFLNQDTQLDLDSESFRRVVDICESRGLWKVITYLYTRYKDTIEVDSKLYPSIANAFASVGPLDEAIQRVKSVLASGEVAQELFKKGQTCYQTLVIRKWKESRDLKEVLALLQDVRSWGGSMVSERGRLHVWVYNAVISACAEAGDAKEAQQCVLKMLEDESLQPDLDSTGHLMLSFAASDDWPTVEAIFQFVQKADFSLTSTKNTSVFFNAALKQYLRNHSASETQLFVSKCVENYGITPDQNTLDIVLGSLVTEGRLTQIPAWVRYMNYLGFPLHVNARTVFLMVQNFYRSYRPDHLLLMTMGSSLQQLDKRLVSKELFDVIQDGIAFDLRKACPTYRRNWILDVEKRLETLRRWRRAVPSLSDMGLELLPAPMSFAKREGASLELGSFPRKDPTPDMVLALSLDRPAEAVMAYKRSLASGFAGSEMALGVAVQASIRANNGCLDESRKLIEWAKDLGANTKDARFPQLVRNLYQDSHPDNQLGVLLQHVYRTTDGCRIPVDHLFTLAAAHHLLNKRKPNAAIELLCDVFHSSCAQRKPMNMQAITTFVRAYTEAADLQGLSWAVNTALSSGLRIDDMFIKQVKRARRAFRQPAEKQVKSADPQPVLQQIDSWIDSCLQRKTEQKLRTRRVGKALVRLCVRLNVRPAKPRQAVIPSEGSVWKTFFWRAPRASDLG